MEIILNLVYMAAASIVLAFLILYKLWVNDQPDEYVPRPWTWSGKKRIISKGICKEIRA